VDGTGVFANGRKFASIGIAVKHWVSMHGIGINIAMELEPWYAVQPCGLSPDLMTDLSRAAGRPIAMHEAVRSGPRRSFDAHRQHRSGMNESR
jgi:lipoate-protein ligase B